MSESKHTRNRRALDFVEVPEHGAAKQALAKRSVVRISDFRNTKLRQARLSFIGRVLEHAESLPQ